MNRLSGELTILILDTLLSDDDRFSFATCCKRVWSNATIVCNVPMNLNKTFTAIDIRRLVHLNISAADYNEAYLKHVLKYASHLKSITFEDRNRFSIQFNQMFMEVEKEIKLMVPMTAYNKFVLVQEDAENTSLDIQFYHKKSLIDVT